MTIVADSAVSGDGPTIRPRSVGTAAQRVEDVEHVVEVERRDGRVGQRAGPARAGPGAAVGGRTRRPGQERKSLMCSSILHSGDKFLCELT